jgi:hypothetical protein
MSFQRGLMRGPLRILCTDCFRENVIARREYSPVWNHYRCPRCLSCLLTAHIHWGRR